jgi:hypothetical protein
VRSVPGVERVGIEAGLTSSWLTAWTAGNSTRQVDGVTVVESRRRIAFKDGHAKLRELIANLVATGAKKVVLNMKNADSVDQFRPWRDRERPCRDP